MQDIISVLHVCVCVHARAYVVREMRHVSYSVR